MPSLSVLLALAAQAAVSQPAAQPDWQPIGVSANGRQAFYDPASVARTGPVTRARLRFAEEGGYALSQVELRCAAYEARIMDAVTYDANGTEVARSELATPRRAIVAGTFLDTLARAVCGAAQGPAGQE